MKSILLYANEDEGFEGRLQAALDLSRIFGSHLLCVQATPYEPFLMGDPFGSVYGLPVFLQQVREAEDAHRGRVEERLGREGAHWDWARYDGAAAKVIARHAILCDLIILSLASEGADPGGELAIVADVTLDVPVPVLAVPPGHKGRDFLGAALVAWNGSAESGHALSRALPLLARATDVHVVTVAEEDAAFPSIDANLYLGRHDIASTRHQWPRAGQSTAAALLDAASTLDAAYIVMGVFGHSRVREAVLGGVTRGMLRQASLPLLLAH